MILPQPVFFFLELVHLLVQILVLGSCLLGLLLEKANFFILFLDFDVPTDYSRRQPHVLCKLGVNPHLSSLDLHLSLELPVIPFDGEVVDDIVLGVDHISELI